MALELWDIFVSMSLGAVLTYAVMNMRFNINLNVNLFKNDVVEEVVFESEQGGDDSDEGSDEADESEEVSAEDDNEEEEEAKSTEVSDSHWVRCSQFVTAFLPRRNDDSGNSATEETYDADNGDTVDLSGSLLNEGIAMD